MLNYQRVGLNSTANVKKTVENTSCPSKDGEFDFSYGVQKKLYSTERVNTISYVSGHNKMRISRSNDLLMLSDFVIVDMWISTKILWVRGNCSLIH